MSITVLKPGMLSTFQDEGRYGYQHQGIPVAGAMDESAHQLANMLAGNSARPATLEITLSGPMLRFDEPACFAITGADLSATLNGRALPLCRPLIARAGSVLAFGKPVQGARAYLAVYGGFALTPVMRSGSTYLRSGFGGLQGRALRKDDRIGLARRLRTDALDALAQTLWAKRIYLPATLRSSPREQIRVLPGPHWAEFTERTHHEFLHQAFRITPQSDRMGFRLQGPPLLMDQPRQILSEATCFGTIQVPAGGEAIVLMADRQTTGGYPKLAQVASIDLPALAQRLPGDTLRFAPIALEEAQALDAGRARAFAALHDSLQPLRDELLQAIDTKESRA
ncbi:biotin-dependent carboxyltransferase family protein [Bordetella avium]|uniref:Histidine kinase inhibitor antagonist n=1 Tax=Bordetella avium (strain 197N) TaxID=360910 RepID=Q2KUF3_BORA1|nr:biotin-dependent carboxyltransferase family protein [Bordetella avium]RIQ55558.1 biotin-dependent carboxyltransferase family protein [Bordetella avium]RIQ73892.1 biotin-dependent carboxyltransferase family protein [Bordetella avium]CAJ50707.1 histidine kinase inhibitor antagonist [Bordetella avium 197N]